MSLTKVNMNLSSKSIDNVNEISKLLRESNETRVVATSLEIARTILEYYYSGKEIIIRSSDKEKQLILELID